jgi:hypothetical protein
VSGQNKNGNSSRVVASYRALSPADVNLRAIADAEARGSHAPAFVSPTESNDRPREVDGVLRGEVELIYILGTEYESLALSSSLIVGQLSQTIPLGLAAAGIALRAPAFLTGLLAVRQRSAQGEGQQCF